MLDEYSQSSAGGSRARFLFANLQQRLVFVDRGVRPDTHDPSAEPR